MNWRSQAGLKADTFAFNNGSLYISQLNLSFKITLNKTTSSGNEYLYKLTVLHAKAGDKHFDSDSRNTDHKDYNIWLNLPLLFSLKRSSSYDYASSES